VINFADVKITLPDGHFRTMTVTLDGVDISHQVNAISFEATADEPLVLVNLRLLAKVQLVGITDTELDWYEPTTLEQASTNYDAAITDFMDAWEKEEN
jgi:hypothetical protein